MDIFYFYTVYPMKTNAFPSIGDLDFFPVIGFGMLPTTSENINILTSHYS